MVDIVLFQDDQVVPPFGLLRHLSLWRSGSLSLLETLFHLKPKASFAVLPFSSEKKQQILAKLALLELSHLTGSNPLVQTNLLKAYFFSRALHGDGSSDKNASKDRTFILINARHVPDVLLLQKTIEETQSLAAGEGFYQKDSWVSAKFRFDKIEKKQVCAADFFSSAKRIPLDNSRLITHSWQALNDLKSRMIAQNKLRIKRGDLVEKHKGVWCPADFKGLHPSVVCDANSDAPIVLERGVEVAPYAVLEAPVYLADFSIVKPHAQISCSAIGRKSKVGGEVQSSVIDDFSNKAHGGFLGHSMLGCWVNVGAGSEFSNLKNTYGSVRFDQGDSSHPMDTGRTFLGSMVGDFAKISINTSILSGKAIGIGAMASGVVGKGLENFHWTAGELVDLSSLLAMQKRMFLRRDVEQTDLHRELLSLVYKD